MQWLYIWIAVLVISVIIEALSMQLMTIWFAIGAICAWIVSVVGGPIWLQLCVFHTHIDPYPTNRAQVSESET